MSKRMVGVKVEGVVTAVGLPEPKLPCSTLEMVQGAAVGFTDEGELVGQLDVNQLSLERQHQVGYKLVQMGLAVLDGKLQIH